MTAQRQPLSKFFRIGLSVLIAAHMMAVVLPPLSFQTRPSPSVSTLLAPVEGYGQFLYIDRGYAFFAPDPGPSHLVQVAITDGSGKKVEIMIPDRTRHWPRLLYHRHFMLTEFLEEIYQPPGPPAELVELDKREAEIWDRARSRYEHVRTSYVDHLKHTHPGKQVAVRRVEHLIPGVFDYQREPISLTDPRLYRVLLDNPIDLGGDDGDLTAPSKPPEVIPPPDGAAVQRDTVDPETEKDGQDQPSLAPDQDAGDDSETDNAKPQSNEAEGEA